MFQSSLRWETKEVISRFAVSSCGSDICGCHHVPETEEWQHLTLRLAETSNFDYLYYLASLVYEDT